MSDFLAANNLCGQTILKLVSKGNAIIANILSLKENVPHVFRLNKAESLKYGDLITDLQYFAEAEAFERKIEQNPALQDLDDELRESYTEILTEFYLLFKSIYDYAIELNRYIEDLNEGFYIQMTLESILSDVEGRQLLVESLYLFGVMLLLIDQTIDGLVRERMITSYYRYCQHCENIDDVCKLLRSTRKTPNYPQDYFSRIEINHNFVNMLISRLMADDIYNQLGSYPLPEHRSTALASQASSLVIILSFAPNILVNETAIMREICTKFFFDNFVVHIYMGFNINLLEYWDGFRAARIALENSKSSKVNGGTKIKALIMELKGVLKEGVLVEENILEKANKVINLLRDSNVVLRWTMLHTAPLNPETSTKKSKATRDQILLETNFDPEVILSLLLHTAELERLVKEMFTKLLDEKESKWMSLKTEAKERIEELSEVFAGTKPLSRVEKNENLFQWLQTKAVQIDSLDFQNLNSSGRKIIELTRAFQQVLEFHNLENNVQVKEWVAETTSCLHRMLRIGSINDRYLVTLQIISDIGYSWGGLIDTFTAQMQSLIQKDPSVIAKLRSVFLKLSSAMDIPLMRLNEAKSAELIKVSAYYSGVLVSYVQKVLQVIPEAVFLLLHEIIGLMTDSVKELPTRLDKNQVKDFAQLEARQQVSRLTHDLTVLTEGVLIMKTTLIGIVRIDSAELLECGIRKELIRQLISLMTTSFTTPRTSLNWKIDQISNRLEGIRRAFEYISDYVNVHGLQIFHQELSRLMNFATEQESNTWKKVKVLPFHSPYQSKEVPIELPNLEDPNAVTFLGKLANELINITDVKLTVYVSGTSTWYDIKTHQPVVSPDTFKLIEEAIEISGLLGLDNLLKFHCFKELEKLVKVCQSDCASNLDALSAFHAELQPPSKAHATSSYSALLSRMSRSLQGQILLRIGQLQLLRKGIGYQLRVSGNLNAMQISSSLEVANRLTSMSLQEGNEKMEDFGYEILSYSEPLGISDPLSKIYVTLKPIQHLPLLLALVTLQQTKKLAFSKSVSSLVSKKASDVVDGMPYVTGLSTFLMQLHPGQTFSFLAYVCQYLNSYIVQIGSSSSVPKKDDELSACFNLLRLFIRYSSRKDTEKFVKLLVPSYEMIPTLINMLS